MELISQLSDEEYPKQEITHTRNIARAILLNDKNEVFLIHIVGDDEFGHRDYWETPGGGIEEGETPEQAVVREIMEETGYESEIICPIGIVSDYYNLIKRHNVGHFFLVRAKEGTGRISYTQEEKRLFKDSGWYGLEKAEALYKSMDRDGIARLVMARELPVLERAIEMVNKL